MYVNPTYNETTIRPGPLLMIIDGPSVSPFVGLGTGERREDALAASAGVEELCANAAPAAEDYLPFTQVECWPSSKLPSDALQDQGLPLGRETLSVGLPQVGGSWMPPDSVRWVMFLEDIRVSSYVDVNIGRVVSTCGQVILYDNVEFRPISWGTACGMAQYDGGVLRVQPHLEAPAQSLSNMIFAYLVRTPFGYTSSDADIQAWRSARGP